jgi:hypothetical protein
MNKLLSALLALSVLAAVAVNSAITIQNVNVCRASKSLADREFEYAKQTEQYVLIIELMDQRFDKSTTALLYQQQETQRIQFELDETLAAYKALAEETQFFNTWLVSAIQKYDQYVQEAAKHAGEKILSFSDFVQATIPPEVLVPTPAEPTPAQRPAPEPTPFEDEGDQTA